MSDFVLVAGAWHGAWCWQRVLPALWQAGQRAFAVTLSGVGERAHELHPDITLAIHINDVVAVIEAEELRGAVLVGHSYAGMVITGVADRLDADRLADSSTSTRWCPNLANAGRRSTTTTPRQRAARRSSNTA
jgi:pimeloyl-ACP methyl ester carboxylesterase